MREFTLITDVNTDVHPGYAKKEGILILPQYYYFEGDDVIYGDEILLDEETFYKRLAAGETAKSSGVNPDRARRTFEEELKKGKDILAIICSSGLSMSYNTCHRVGEELMEQYPGSKIIVIDSLNESGGAGLMLYVARDMQKEGKTMEKTDAKSLTASWWMTCSIWYGAVGFRLSAEPSERCWISNPFCIWMEERSFR